MSGRTRTVVAASLFTLGTALALTPARPSAAQPTEPRAVPRGAAAVVTVNVGRLWEHYTRHAALSGYLEQIEGQVAPEPSGEPEAVCCPPTRATRQTGEKING